MGRAAQSVFVFGIYLCFAGASFAVAPEAVMPLLGFATSLEAWPRVAGVLALALAFYYLLAARYELTPFFRWTVAARLGVVIGFVLLVVLDLAPAPLLLLAGVDLAAAIWTAAALASERS